MNPELLYDKRIKDLEREVRNLKTGYFKTATTINTMTENQTLNFSLSLNPNAEIFSTQRAIITLDILDNSNMISACYLTGVNPNNLNNRFAFVKRLQSNNNQVKYEVLVYSQNPDDYDTLSGGGSVNLTYTVQLVGSSRFTSSVNYRSITGGSS